MMYQMEILIGPQRGHQPVPAGAHGGGHVEFFSLAHFMRLMRQPVEGKVDAGHTDAGGNIWANPAAQEPNYPQGVWWAATRRSALVLTGLEQQI